MTDLDAHIERTLNGETDAYTFVVETCESRVRAVIAAMSPDPNTVPDLTQEVFIIAYDRLDRYQLGTNFLAWLRTIARNVAQNARRRWYRQQHMKDQYQAEVEDAIGEEIDRIVSNLPEEMFESLQECISNLGGKTRELVDGFYFDEEAIRDIASRLDITPNSAKVTLHRARHALGNCLKKKGHDHV